MASNAVKYAWPGDLTLAAATPSNITSMTAGSGMPSESIAAMRRIPQGPYAASATAILWSSECIGPHRSDDIGERLPELVEPRVAEDEHQRRQHPELPQSLERRRMIVQEYVPVSAHQYDDRIPGQHQRSRRPEGSFGVADGGEEEPERQEKADCLPELAHENTQ